jgi:hypothetical protein
MSPSTCSYFYNSDLLLCVINLQHRPLIEPNITRTQSLPWCNHWCIKNQNNNYRSLQAPRSTHSTITSTKPTNLPFFALELQFLYRHAMSYSSFPLNSCIVPSHPLFVIHMFHIMHKQTKFPTQTHKSL